VDVTRAVGSKKRTRTAPVEFIFQYRKYAWNRKAGCFLQIRPDCHAPLASYAKAPRYGDKNGDKRVKAALQDFGMNQLDVHVPSFTELLLQRLRSPMTCLRAVDTILTLSEGFPFLALQGVVMTLWSWWTSAKSSLAHIKRVRKEVMKGAETAGMLIAYRAGEWKEVAVTSVVPGDVIGLPTGLKEAPVDCLLLKGDIVVDEAILTGESLPQMKKPLGVKGSSDNETALDMEGQHRSHVLFSGTKIIRIEEGTEAWPSFIPSLPSSQPRVKVVGVVLRTGYHSTQGELLRMIDLRSGKVQSDSPEAVYIIAAMSFVSLACAVGIAFNGVSAGRSSYKIVMQCIRILSSGIPFYLMDSFGDTVARGVDELALKAHVVCTEPYRVPLAGRVDTCLFDKTGTLTTEHLFLQGVVIPLEGQRSDGKPAYQLPNLTSLDAQMVLGACHSLVDVDNKLAGDTLELSALDGVGWTYNATTNVAKPKRLNEKSPVTILRRHDFSSALQRMSVLVQEEDGTKRALVKGSPEAIWELLRRSSRVDKAWYDSTYKSMASDGTRVLALAWKPVTEKGAYERELLENDLTFVGFAGFRTRIRDDSRSSILHLRRAGVETAVVSGDSLLTSLHVAREVGIVRMEDHLTTIRLSGKDLKKSKKSKKLNAVLDKPHRPVAILDLWPGKGKKRLNIPQLAWVSEDGKRRIAKFKGWRVGQLAESYELCTEGVCLAQALKESPEMAQYLHHIRVYARMTPGLKETVVRFMKSAGKRTVLMCGDGANDVGALKQADIGVALLTGFGAANAATQDGAGDNAQEKKSNLLRTSAEMLKERNEVLQKEFLAILKAEQDKGKTGA